MLLPDLVNYFFNLFHTGTICDENIPCFTNHCQNNGTCLSIGFTELTTCECTENFTGEVCETLLPCSEHSCVFGSCVDSADFSDYTCDCSNTQYTGPFCDTEVHNTDSNFLKTAGAGLGVKFGTGTRYKYDGKIVVENDEVYKSILDDNFDLIWDQFDCENTGCF